MKNKSFIFWGLIGSGVLFILTLIIRPLFSVFSLPEIQASAFLDENKQDPESEVATKVAKQLLSQGQIVAHISARSPAQGPACA